MEPDSFNNLRRLAPEIVVKSIIYKPLRYKEGT